MITDRIHFMCFEVNTNNLLSDDLIVKNGAVRKNLSGASIVSFDLDYGQQVDSAAGINFKTWGQWIVPYIPTDTYGNIFMGAQLINKVQPDPKTGDLHIEGLGFMGYPKGIPLLIDYNPIAVDPVEYFQRIWQHLEDFVNANLGVDVLGWNPINETWGSTSGTQLLPGFGFDGQTLDFNFFALFIRQSDFNDCQDQIDQLAKDLPLDMVEYVAYDGTTVTKTIRVSYPFGGVEQDNLAFRLGENVTNAELADDLEIEPVSDIIIRSWIPGRTYSAMLSNADMTRARRVEMEEAVNISNTERAAAYAKRKLTKRNIPVSFQKITIDPNHPNAPFGSYDVGDSIYIECPNYPWVGDIEQWHRITYIDYKDGQPTAELGTKVEGAFNYDPIIYDPNAETQPGVDPNLLPNGYFTDNMGGWYQKKGTWIRLATYGHASEGCVLVVCNDHGEELQSSKIGVNPKEVLHFEGWVNYTDIVQSGGSPTYTFAIGINFHKDGGDVTRHVVTNGFLHTGTGGYTEMQGSVTIPDDGVNEVSVSLLVDQTVASGQAEWDDIKLIITADPLAGETDVITTIFGTPTVTQSVPSDLFGNLIGDDGDTGANNPGQGGTGDSG